MAFAVEGTVSKSELKEALEIDVRPLFTDIGLI